MSDRPAGAGSSIGNRVVVIGDVMTDVVTRPVGPPCPGTDTTATIACVPGGAGANVAHWLASFGATVTFVGAVGDDAAGRDAVRVLSDAGVDVQVTRVDEPTGTVVVLVDPADGERTFLSDQGANARLTAAPLPPDTAHLHISGYVVHAPSNRAVARAAIDDARRAAVTVSVDAASEAPLRQMGAGLFFEAIAGVDLLVVTLDECDALVGTRDPDAAIARLLPHVPTVVVKCGGAGVRAAGRAGTATCPAAPPAGPVVDRTGAGDAFMAALLAARMGGQPMEAAMAAGCRAAATAVATAGARPPAHPADAPSRHERPEPAT